MTRIYPTKAAFETGEAPYELKPVGLFLGATLLVSVAVFYNASLHELVLVTLG